MAFEEPEEVLVASMDSEVGWEASMDSEVEWEAFVESIEK